VKKEELKVVLLDDELLALSYLRTLCESIEAITVVKVFDNPEKLVAELPTLDFDCCISDIVMPQKTGLEIAEKLGDKAIIFCSAHNEFAADAYDIEAVDYLRKPIQRERLERALEKTRRLIEFRQSSDAWLVNTSRGKMAIPLTAIVAFSSDAFDRRDKNLLLKNGETFTIKNKSFDQLLEELHTLPMIRISKSELLVVSVIRNCIQHELFTNVMQKNGTFLQFNVGENYLKNVREQLSNL
jgi:two-component system LytT family response regulator